MKRSWLGILFLLITCLPEGKANYCLAKEAPYLTIVSPKEGEIIFGDKVTFSFVVSGFILGIDGYLRVSLDQKEAVIIKEPKEFSFTNLDGGEHKIVSELVDKRGHPFSPPVKSGVSFKSILPNREEEVNIPPSSIKTKKKRIYFFPFLLGIGTALLLALKLYINSKKSKNRSHQKPLG